MKILDLRAYRGPNLWSHDPVIKMKVDLEDLEERPSNKIEGFVVRLLGDATRYPRNPVDEGNLVQLGYGIHQKRIQATVTSHTNLIA